MDVGRFKRLPLMGILRGIEQKSLGMLVETIVLAGMQTIEITMNTENASYLIRKATKLAGQRLMIGAGTVLDLDTLKEAINAGATFIVMPTLVDKVMDYCLKHKIAVFPGALSPQEIYTAWQKGATMIKVFPACVFGPEYFRYLKGPFPHIPLMAVGGVKAENIADYFVCRVNAVAIGESIFNRNLIKNKKFSVIKKTLVKLVKQTESNIGIDK